MKRNKLGWLIQGSLKLAALAVCAAVSASAGTVKRSVAHKHYKYCYVRISGTNVPQSCERFHGIASTADSHGYQFR